MKLIVFLVLISNICLSQDLLVPRKLIEGCREKYEEVNKMSAIIIDKDIIINNRDKRIETDSIENINKDKAIVILTTISLNKDSIRLNKESEIVFLEKQIKKNKKIIIGLGVLDILLLILLL